MPASIEFCESNTVGETVTHNVSNDNFGNADLASMDANTHAIVPGAPSFVKYDRIHVTNLNGSVSIDDIRIWQAGGGGLGGAATHVSNLSTSAYGGAITYATPVAAPVTGVSLAVPLSLPVSTNLGIGGSLAGALVAPGYSDYFVHQLVTGVNDTTGGDSNINIQYGEVL